ncbi:Cellular retinoic acid-binding protein 1 [Trichoplax sp. H2]|nr:Cellular retinoic acid-binding protein 1 [Trichoplax sp. H2]|eukprot:RDD36685.1 Cellular retinoic acid-binding protein 1 [Trichoplax sp. H2]
MAEFNSENPLVGKWRLDRTENFDDYLKATGINIIKRQLAKKTSHVEQTIQCQESNKVYIKIWSRVLTKTDTYILGEEIDEELLEGEKVKGTMTYEDGKLLDSIKGSKKPCFNSRVMEGSQMVHEFTYDGVSCKRFYNKTE